MFTLEKLINEVHFLGIKNYAELLNDSSFVDAIREKKLCLFLGAGVAYNLDMPNWWGLANKIIGFCLQDKIVSHSYVKTLEVINDPLIIISFCVQEIEKKEKTKEFDDLLNRIFIQNPKSKLEEDRANGKPNIYEKLIEICKTKKALLVQTNYDSVIEDQTVSSTGIQAYIPFKDSTQTNLENCLVYLHGKFKKEQGKLAYEELVLTRKQYNDVYVLESQQNERFAKQKTFFKKLLDNYYVVFLGYSLQDVEIVQLIANRSEVKNYIKIAIIIDECEAKQFINRINANYLYEASNGNVVTYLYSTEDDGFEAFDNVINDLSTKLNTAPDSDDITIFQDSSKVDF